MLCKNCGRKVSWNTVRCGQCGCETFVEETSPTEEASIAADSPVTDKVAEPLATDNNIVSNSATYNNPAYEKEKIIFCKNCGHEVSKTSRFCTECGHTLNNQNNEANSASQPYNNSPQGVPNGYNQGGNYNYAPPYNNFPQGNTNNYTPKSFMEKLLIKITSPLADINDYPSERVIDNLINNCIYQTKASSTSPFIKSSMKGTVFLCDNELIYKYYGGVALCWEILLVVLYIPFIFIFEIENPIIGILPALILEIMLQIIKKNLIVRYNEISEVYNKGKSVWVGYRFDILLHSGKTIRMYIPPNNYQQFLSILNEKRE